MWIEPGVLRIHREHAHQVMYLKDEKYNCRELRSFVSWPSYMRSHSIPCGRMNPITKVCLEMSEEKRFSASVEERTAEDREKVDVP